MNQDSEAINRIIQEVALKHGIALGPDDPVLVVYTINHQLMQCSARIQQEVLERFHKELEATGRKWQSATVRQTDMAIQTGLQAAQDVMAETIRSEIDTALKQLKIETHGWQLGANLVILAAVMALAASATVLWTVL